MSGLLQARGQRSSVGSRRRSDRGDGHGGDESSAGPDDYGSIARTVGPSDSLPVSLRLRVDGVEELTIGVLGFEFLDSRCSAEGHDDLCDPRKLFEIFSPRHVADSADPVGVVRLVPRSSLVVHHWGTPIVASSLGPTNAR
jgi:hypothetical protein